MTVPDNLPALPKADFHLKVATTIVRPESHTTESYDAGMPLFTADQMRQYGLECARLERERCAVIAEGDEFYGNATQAAIAAAIRNQQGEKEV